MKIALYNVTTTIKAGGVETCNWEMARVLAARGHDVHLFGGRSDSTHVSMEGVTILTFPFIKRSYFPDFGSRFRKFMERLSFAAFTIKDLIKGSYDFIYLVKPFDIPAALATARLSGAKTIFASGGTEFFPGYKQLAGRVDHFFACSDYNAGQIENYCGLRPVVLPNGVNTDLFKPLLPDVGLGERYRLIDADFVVISACRLVGLKGLDYAINAIAELIGRGHALKYLIVGEGPAGKDLEALARQLNIGDHVIFTGRVDNAELPRYYSLADLALYPSVGAETFGIAMGEALACCVPVVSTKVGGIPEVVREGTGLLTPPKDAGALVRAVGTLMIDDDLREQFGRAGNHWIAGNLTWAAAAERLEKHLIGSD